MSIDKLSLREYSKLKEHIYNICVYDIDFPEKKMLENYQTSIHKKYNNAIYDKIIDDTIQFPYDLELFNFINEKKASPETLMEAVNKFGISYELLQSKMKEYVIYQFHTCLEQGLIDYNIIFKLSKHYLTLSEEKNNKSVDF